MSYTTIADQLEVILEAVTSVKKVFPSEPKELGEYPAATIRADGHNDVAADTAANNRVFTFIITLYYPTSDDLYDQILRGVADDVINAIESNVRINSACDFARPTAGKWGYTQREIPERFVELRIDALKRVNR